VNPLDTSKRDFADSPVAATRPASALGVRQLLIVALLFGGYAACYFCRADFSVATPLLIDELGRPGVGHADALVHIGQIASLGVFTYALGKLFLTGIGLGGASVFTLLFTLGGTVPVFTIAWIGNRLTQSIAWAGLLKVSSKWFDFSSHGTVARETFNTWTPVYLRDYLGYSLSGAASASAIFPGVGALSVIATGWLSDRLGVNVRAAVMAVGLLAHTPISAAPWRSISAVNRAPHSPRASSMGSGISGRRWQVTRLHGSRSHLAGGEFFWAWP
jgi:sugar phosphate permease